MNLRILATLLLLTACAKPGPGAAGPPPTETTIRTQETVQIANPASAHCLKQGGALEIVQGPQGEAGVCVLPGGVRCDEWAYFRKQCP
jgi:putative hemolysin